VPFPLSDSRPCGPRVSMWISGYPIVRQLTITATQWWNRRSSKMITGSARQVAKAKFHGPRCSPLEGCVALITWNGDSFRINLNGSPKRVYSRAWDVLTSFAVLYVRLPRSCRPFRLRAVSASEWRQSVSPSTSLHDRSASKSCSDLEPLSS